MFYPRKLENYYSVFIVYHQYNIYDYRLESSILMWFFLALFQFHFKYHITMDNIVTVLNVLESVIRNIDTCRNVYNVIFHVISCNFS